MSAQEKLSKEEKESREKNIQAGNPFKQFGYKGKVATLSKGKYLEVHDLDSIVTIGSIRFHVDRKEIIGIVAADSTHGEYSRPVGDLPSRWLSPDPLAEEYPNWSPYRYGFNNPVRYSDPTGLLENDDVVITGSGKDKAFSDLQASSPNLEMTMDKNGKVSATAKQGATLTDADNTLLAATTDKSVTVEINAIKENFVETSAGVKSFDGGAFMGSTVNPDGTVTANQTVNPQTASIIDNVSGQSQGTVMKHETLEAYIGAKQNPGSGDAIASPAAYQSAHNAANAMEPNRNPANAIITTQGNKRVITNSAGNSKVLYKLK